MANRMTVELSIAGQGDEDPTLASSVESFDYEERLGLPFRLTVDVRFEGDVNPSNAVGRVATLTFVKENQEPRSVVGLVMNVTQLGTPVVGGMIAADAVRFEIASDLAQLAFSEGCEIFQELDVKEIVTQVLETHGIAADRQKWQLAGTYEKRTYCVRYRESALAFVSRLLEQEGIYFHSEAEDGQEKIIFGDDSPSAGASPELETMSYGGHGVIDTGADVVVSIGDSAELASGQIVLRDYNFEKPSLDLTTTESADAFDNLSLYDYPGRYGTPELGTHYAKVRLEAEQVERSTVEFEHTSPHVGAGLKLEIEGAVYEEQNGELFVFSSRLSYTRTGSGQNASERFSGFARALPIAIKFRAPHETAWPRIVGPQTAYIVAPAGSPGETIHTDEHGRCKVKFPWDLSPEIADKASCWMRVTQLQTSGSMIIPRIGWEVVVDFLEGDPDRPVIAGRVYNGMYMPPYALPEGKTRTSMQSATTPGGGGRNEIRLEDKAGAEEIMVHAQYNHNVAVANDKSKTVKNCESRNVTANDTLTIGGNQTAKITKGMRETVTGSQSLSVGGNRDVEVNAVTGINAAGSIAGTVGGNHFEMDGNPLAALLALAAEAATEALQAAASQAMAQVEAAVQSRVDQALGPITELTGQVEEVASAMEALQDGDPSAVAGVLAGAAGLPMPDALASAMGGGGDEAGGGEDGGAEPGGEGGEGEAEDNSMVHALGLDSAVDNAIATGLSRGADALAEALGIGGGGGGGSSEANQAGPEGNVDGIAQEDRAKGPGHQLANITGSHTETIGSVKIAATVQTVDANVGGSLTETVGAAKVTMTWGNITADITGDASETALGTITVSRADESLSSEGDKMALVGGAIFEKIGGNHSITAGGPATFLGLFHKVEASGSITFKCGASEVVVDGSGISISSPAVAILSPQIQLTKDVSEV